MTVKIDKIAVAVERRQKILDFLVDNPRSPARDIGKAVGMSTDAVGCMIRDQIEMGEVQSHGKARAMTYTACKITTRSADDIRAKFKAKCGWKKPTGQPERRNKDFPVSHRAGVLGVTVNNPSKHSPNHGKGGVQGGQLASSSVMRSSQMATCKVSV